MLDAKAQIIAARARLSELLADLQTAEPRKVPLILHRIQRQRVIVMTYQEIALGTIDEDLHREIALLAKVDPNTLDDDAERNEAEQVAASAQLLADRGLTPESAARIARVLSTAAQALPMTVAPVVEAPAVPAMGDRALEPDPDFTADPD